MCVSIFQVQQIDRVVEVVDEAVKGILTHAYTHLHKSTRWMSECAAMY